MQGIWLVVFVCSLMLLLIVLIRKKRVFRWIGYAAMNIVLAAVVLYVINLTEVFTDFRIPINAITVLTVGVLGIPGLLLLIALRLTLF